MVGSDSVWQVLHTQVASRTDCVDEFNLGTRFHRVY